MSKKHFCKDCKFYSVDNNTEGMIEWENKSDMPLEYYCKKEDIINHRTGEEQHDFDNFSKNYNYDCSEFIYNLNRDRDEKFGDRVFLFVIIVGLLFFIFMIL